MLEEAKVRVQGTKSKVKRRRWSSRQCRGAKKRSKRQRRYLGIASGGDMCVVSGKQHHSYISSSLSFFSLTFAPLVWGQETNETGCNSKTWAKATKSISYSSQMPPLSRISMLRKPVVRPFKLYAHREHQESHQRQPKQNHNQINNSNTEHKT